MHVLVSRGHLLLGLSNSNFFRKCKAGRYGPISFDAEGRQQVSIAAIERVLGKTFTPDELHAVDGKLAAKPASPTKVPTSDQSHTREQLLPFDPGWLAAGAEQQRLTDQRHLIANNIHDIELPPISPDLAPCLTTQQVLTTSQVEKLLTQAVRERDRQWESWILNPIERAQFPDGPLLLDFPKLLSPHTNRRSKL